jgi:hypothetical protein
LSHCDSARFREEPAAAFSGSACPSTRARASIKTSLSLTLLLIVLYGYLPLLAMIRRPPRVLAAGLLR